MFWQEDDQTQTSTSEMVDASFQIRCKSLPYDHAQALSEALSEIAPWFAEHEQTALHLIPGAASQNGWTRPEKKDADILLSKRTRLELRVPPNFEAELDALQGQTLEIAGQKLELIAYKIRALNPYPVVFSRHVPIEEADLDEQAFLSHIAQSLAQMDIQLKKAMCGTEDTIQIGQRKQLTRRLMIADLKPEESLRIQSRGLGGLQKHGLGVFVPHKGINSLDNPEQQNQNQN